MEYFWYFECLPRFESIKDKKIKRTVCSLGKKLFDFMSKYASK